MNVELLPALEENMRLTGNNGEYSFSKLSIPVPGEDLVLEGLFCKPRNRSGYYYAIEHPKERIVIHFTAGNTKSDLSALTRNDFHVSVPFVIGRDGTIYQLYSSKNWSGNIGKGLGNEGTGNAQDKCTIAIEISNYGFLTKNDGNLETYYSRQKDSNGKVGPVDVYCKLTDLSAYTQLATPFRGQSYYATFTEEQYNSLIILLRYLTSQYNIPRQFLPEEKRYQTTEDVLSFKGIVSHVNYRKDGKWDIGPAFDWVKVIEGVQTDKYIPTVNRSVEVDITESRLPLITSEEALIALQPTPKDAALEDEPYEEEFEGINEEKSGSNFKPTLYALLVGIGDYASEIRLANDRVRFPKLSGCVSDVSKIKTYLKKEDYYKTEIEVLINKDASKSEIVRLFQEHLYKAGEKDVVLFYYSGHGTQEYTDKAIFTSETDGKLECVVCYYDEQTKENFLLADKEIRWLIHNAAAKAPHIVTIFDCCHSSGMTRNGELVDAIFPEVVEKRIPFVFPQRKWEDFIFSDPHITNYITEDKIRNSGEYSVLPEAAHIQLSACESNESAVEVSGEGVFTKALLKVLNSADGEVSYQMLNNRVRQYLRSIYEQKPMFYIATSTQSIRLSTFLNKPSNPANGGLGDVTYNEKIGWQVNLGALQGINNSITQILLFDSSKNDRTYISRPGVVSIDSTQLIVDNAELLDKERIYKANLTGLMSKVLRVFIAPGNALPEDQLKLLNEITENSKEFIELVDEEQAADYCLRYNNGNYFITYRDDPYRPLTELVGAGNNNKWIDTLIGHFKHISAWSFIKSITNNDENSQLADNAISIKVATGKPLGDLRPVTVEDPNITITYTTQKEQFISAIKIEITNTSDGDLYCCPVYLTSSFQSFTGFLNPAVYFLEPNETVNLNLEGTGEISIVLSKMIKWYNWSSYYDYFKFIVSNEPFEAGSLQLEPLPEPPEPGTRGRGEKGLVTVLPKQNVNRGWRTYDIRMEFVNPNFNVISQQDLDRMLRDENTNYFGTGLYYNISVDEHLQAVYTLKPTVQIVGEPAIRGVIQDTGMSIANWYARKKRNQHYFDLLARFPTRLKIVSEGDSWFQHPLVLDIIDHLSKIYAIYCVAAAGDTLSNYLSDKNKRGEYFLDAIEKQQPQYFLISGGGNDILGSKFRNFLVDNPGDVPKEAGPAGFLNESLTEKVSELMELYKSLFGHLELVKPNLQIIIHGYDYPVKLNDKNRGWLGRHMMEKGISAPEDRRSIIHYIMDEFNTNLEITCKDFKNVHYLDVRNIIRYDEACKVDQWYDEIHPTDDGFQQIAMKFIQKINELEKLK